MHNSGFGLYIATEDIPGFRQASEIDEEDPKTKIQLELLSSCLYLRDLKNNNTNYGVDDQGELRIVDFEIHAHKQNSQKIANNFFSRNKQLRFDVGKAAFLSWDLLKNIDLANASIEDQKKLLNKHSITFTVDRNFDDYLTAIKKNVTLIAKYFE
ncbi:unnamed protein product [Caenorhabditis angaria]|uniref:Uncharacterized protein n=1 Tax=Caenorhabditis angaria TaxID=860376 RepID=A0A9P1IKU6_9PELO|nr:unnamed protein product [Caenorhabditis angaria]